MFRQLPLGSNRFAFRPAETCHTTLQALAGSHRSSSGQLSKKLLHSTGHRSSSQPALWHCHLAPLQASVLQHRASAQDPPVVMCSSSMLVEIPTPSDTVDAAPCSTRPSLQSLSWHAAAPAASGILAPTLHCTKARSQPISASPNSHHTSSHPGEKMRSHTCQATLPPWLHQHHMHWHHPPLPPRSGGLPPYTREQQLTNTSSGSCRAGRCRCASHSP